MKATIIDGKAVAARMREEIRPRVEVLKNKGVEPCLAVILIGEDPASVIYVRNKEKAFAEAGMTSRIIRLPEGTTQVKLLSVIKELNDDPQIHGILPQMPVPRHIDQNTAQNSIDPKKDVDGFHPYNFGRLLAGQKTVEACTPKGIIELLKCYDVTMSGAKAVIVGRSNIVGKPMAQLLLQNNATVTICHSKTKDLAAETRLADILVVAIGSPKFITGDMIKPGAAVIDVGTNRKAGSKKLTGDVDFEAAEQIAGFITPVPGGVGPMTIAMLLVNTLEAAENGV